ncbi:MAG: hypothetical protein ABWZ99_15105 [Ilumatobacteraceae bacterium]
MTNPEPPPSTPTESTVDRPTPGVPSDSATLTEMLNSLAEEGFVHQFTPLEGASLECSQCATTVDAASLDVLAIRRLEGASDPDDMMSLVAARCPHCDALGTLLLGYGVNASIDDADISRALNVSDEVRQSAVTPPARD